MMSVFVVVLACVAGLLALAAAIASIAGVRVPPLVFGLGLATAPAIGLVSARLAVSEAVSNALSQGITGWISTAAPRLVEAWQPAAWASLVVAVVCVIVALFTAIGGIARGPRRWGLAGLGLGWTVLVFLAVGLPMVALTDVRVLSLGGGGALAAVVIFGVLGSVSLLGGGPKSGPEAAGLGGLVAAVGLTSAAVWILVADRLTAAEMWQVAPADSMTLFLAATDSMGAWMQLSALLMALGGVGFVALGSAPARSALTTALASLGAAIALPLLTLATTTVPAMTQAASHVAALPIALPAAGVLLPTGRGDYGHFSGEPAVEVTPGGWFWLSEGHRTRLAISDGAPIRDLRQKVDEAWPSPAPPPVVFIDARVRAEVAKAAIDGVMRGPHATRIGVRGRYGGDVIEYWSVRYPDDATSPVVRLDRSIATMAGCPDGACDPDKVAGVLRGAPGVDLRATGGVHIDPDTPWGLVPAAAAALGDLGADSSQIVFQARLAVDPAVDSSANEK